MRSRCGRRLHSSTSTGGGDGAMKPISRGSCRMCRHPASGRSSRLPPMVQIERRGDVTIMRMDAGENRFNPGSLDSLEAAFDEVGASEGPAAIVLTGTGK